jgi:ferredoxin
MKEIRIMSRELLERREVDGVLGLRQGEYSIVEPHVFRDPEEIPLLVTEPKWPLAKMAMKVLRDAPEGFRLAVVARGCDDRALVELAKRNQVPEKNLRIIGVACTEALAKECLCDRPYPREIHGGKPEPGVSPFADPKVRALLEGDFRERMKRWASLLRRCIKCYGCRNACPICVCVPCKLEDEVWVEKGSVPAEMLVFHLIRAFHLSDTCVACGACQEACPVSIPLLSLQLAMRRALKEEYGYEPGLERDRRSPVLKNAFEEPGARRSVPAWVSPLEENHD